MIIFWWTRLNISARKSRSFEWLEAHVRSCSAASRWLCPSLALTTTTTTTTTRWNSLSKVKILNLEWKKKVFKKVFSKNVFFAARRRFRFGWNELGPKKPDRLKLKKKIGAKFVFRKKLFSADQKFVQNHILGFFFHLTAWNFNFSTDPYSSTQPPSANNPAQSPIVPIRDV